MKTATTSELLICRLAMRIEASLIRHIVVPQDALPGDDFDSLDAQIARNEAAARRAAEVVAARFGPESHGGIAGRIDAIAEEVLSPSRGPFSQHLHTEGGWVLSADYEAGVLSLACESLDFDAGCRSESVTLLGGAADDAAVADLVAANFGAFLRADREECGSTDARGGI